LRTSVLLLLYCSIIFGNSFAQTRTWSNEQLIAANTAANVPGLTIEEKNVFLYLNLARLYPNDFSNIELRSHFGDRYSNSNALNWYEESLKNELLSMSSLHALTYSSEMYELARCFSKEQSRTGLTGHKRSSCSAGFGGECCSYGHSSGRKVVIQLLIDDGISSLGHRKLCLSPNYFSIGPSMNTHTRYNNMCVIDFSYSSGIDYSSSVPPKISSSNSTGTSCSNSTNTNSGSVNSNSSSTLFDTYVNEIADLKNKLSKLNNEITQKDATISNLNRENSKLKDENYQTNSAKESLRIKNLELEQQKNANQNEYNRLNKEFQLLSNRRTSVRKSEYNSDDFHAFTMKIGLNAFYPYLRANEITDLDPNQISYGVESMIGFNFGTTYRRNSIGLTFRLNQANRFLTKSMSPNSIQPIQLYDTEFSLILREFFTLGLGTTISTSYGMNSYEIQPSSSLGFCIGPKNWKFQIIQQISMDKAKDFYGRVSLGLSLRI
jgi:hypothetical protein